MKKMLTKWRAGWALMLFVAVLFMGFTAPAQAYDKVLTWDRISATAGENLTLGQLVCLKDADGEAYKADADDAALRPAIGVVGMTTSDGDTVEIVVRGILSGWSSLSEGGWAYLSETAGAVTQSAPSYNQIVGVAISTTEYMFNFASYLDASSVTSIGTLSGATPLEFEGATADDYETSLSPEDPTADRTVTLPDYTGGVPLIIAQGSTQTNANNGTEDVTGSSLSLADGWFTAGKTLKWTVYGTCAGANAAKHVILYIDNAAIVDLTLDAADVGDFVVEFIMHEHTDTANQDAMGRLTMNDEAVYVDYATDTTDMNDGGATTVKLQLTSGDAGDTITADYVVVEHWNK